MHRAWIAVLLASCGCVGFPVVPRGFAPNIVPNELVVQGVVDEMVDILSTRTRGRGRPTLTLEPLVNRTGRHVDRGAMRTVLVDRLEQFRVVDLVGEEPERSPDLVARVALSHEPVLDEPGATIFRFDLIVGENDSRTLVAICSGSWKEVLPRRGS